MNNTDYIVGLDIGTTKIACMVGKRNEHGKIEIIGMGKAESLGVMRGVVANIEKTVDAIKIAVAQAQDLTKVQIKNVYVGIAGQHIKSLQHQGSIVRDDMEIEISRADIKRLTEDMRKLVVAPGDRIIHVLPQEYIVDNEGGIKDPIGMCGMRLEANFHIITGQIAAAQNIRKCVEKAGLNMVDLILEPLASSDSVLSEEEKEAGVALVDIGGGTTDIAIFHDGIIRHTYVIPFGGNIITEDIREGCLVMKQQAENLKVKCGSAVAEKVKQTSYVTIPGLKGREPKEISVQNLASIIQARLEEIFELVNSEIIRSGYRDKLIAGIVVTGGGAQMQHLVQLVEFVTGLDARIGLPTEHIAAVKLETIKHPMYSTGIGLIMKGFEDHDRNGEQQSGNVSIEKPEEKSKPMEATAQKPDEEKRRKGLLGSFFKNWIEDDVDNDFTTKK